MAIAYNDAPLRLWALESGCTGTWALESGCTGTLVDVPVLGFVVLFVLVFLVCFALFRLFRLLFVMTEAMS